MKALFFTYLFSITIIQCSAQLYFKNNSSSPVDVAFAMKNNSSNNKSWYTEGWFHCEPQERVKLSSAVGLHKYVYYHANATDGSGSWGHGDYSKKFLVDVDAFDIKNADLQYVKDRNPNYYWKTFSRIRIGTLKTKYTIAITD